MKTLLLALALTIASGSAALADQSHASTTIASTYGSPVQMFSTADTAQQHCPNDTVVWLSPSGIYHYRGERWFGRTKRGAYVCEQEAIAAGDRASENGQ